VWSYAAAHNQYLIQMAPEHLTVWHYRIPFTQDHTLSGNQGACVRHEVNTTITDL
jgi:hypothetical protein